MWVLLGTDGVVLQYADDITLVYSGSSLLLNLKWWITNTTVSVWLDYIQQDKVEFLEVKSNVAFCIFEEWRSARDF